MPEPVQQRNLVVEHRQDRHAAQKDQPVVQAVAAVGEPHRIADDQEIRIHREHANSGIVGRKPLGAPAIERVDAGAFHVPRIEQNLVDVSGRVAEALGVLVDEREIAPQAVGRIEITHVSGILTRRTRLCHRSRRRR